MGKLNKKITEGEKKMKLLENEFPSFQQAGNFPHTQILILFIPFSAVGERRQKEGRRKTNELAQVFTFQNHIFYYGRWLKSGYTYLHKNPFGNLTDGPIISSFELHTEILSKFQSWAVRYKIIREKFLTWSLIEYEFEN